MTELYSFKLNKLYLCISCIYIFTNPLLEEDMAGSFVFTHYEFFKNVGKESSERNRTLYIRTINADIMRAFSKIVSCILNNYVPPLSHDHEPIDLC